MSAPDVKGFTVVLGCERCALGYAINRWFALRPGMPRRAIISRYLGLCNACAEIGGEG